MRRRSASSSSAAPSLDRGRFGEPRCDHCHLRRQRAQTFVLWHAASGRVRQVGSGCLRDFLDGHDAERLCRQAESVLLARQALIAAAGPAPRVGAESRRASALELFAAHAAMAVRANGWVSRERARRSSRPASADAALQSLEAAPDAPQAADLALAEGALRWARELLAAQPRLSTFERDAVAVVNSPTVRTGRDRGLVCALIAVYRRRRLRSRHLGAIGEWLDAVVLVERLLEQPSTRHGAVTRHDLIDVDGNRLVWWQTAWRTAAGRAGDPPARPRRAPHPLRSGRGHRPGSLPPRLTGADHLLRVGTACASNEPDL